MVHRMVMSPATARWAQREPGPEEWHPGGGYDVRVVLKPHQKSILFDWYFGPIANGYIPFLPAFYVSFLLLHPVCGLVLTSLDSSFTSLLAVSSTVSSTYYVIMCTHILQQS